MSLRIGLVAILAGLVLSGGCARSGRSGPATQPAVELTTRPAEQIRVLPQPRLREVLVDLGEEGVDSAPRAPVFVLSHWMMYNRPGEEEDPNRPRFEGAPFEYEGAKFFLAIGPVYHGLKLVTPPPKDLLVKSPPGKNDQGGATIMLAGQTWNLGFSMKDGDEKLGEKMTGMLSRWLERYRGR